MKKKTSSNFSSKKQLQFKPTVGGLNPSEKYDFVNWDDEIPNIWNNKIHVPNHQPDIFLLLNGDTSEKMLAGWPCPHRPPQSDALTSRVYVQTSNCTYIHHISIKNPSVKLADWWCNNHLEK